MVLRLYREATYAMTSLLRTIHPCGHEASSVFSICICGARMTRVYAPQRKRPAVGKRLYTITTVVEHLWRPTRNEPAAELPSQLLATPQKRGANNNSDATSTHGARKNRRTAPDQATAEKHQPTTHMNRMITRNKTQQGMMGGLP